MPAESPVGPGPPDSATTARSGSGARQPTSPVQPGPAPRHPGTGDPGSFRTDTQRRIGVEISVELGHNLTVDPETPIFVISVAAQLAGMHPQTLRQYDRLGLVSPGRTAGRGRRYSARDVAMLREVQRLSQDHGVNLAGVKRILELELEVDALRDQVDGLVAQLAELTDRLTVVDRVFAAGPGGDIVAVPPGRRPQRQPSSSALVVWRPGRHR